MSKDCVHGRSIIPGWLVSTAHWRQLGEDAESNNENIPYYKTTLIVEAAIGRIRTVSFKLLDLSVTKVHVRPKVVTFVVFLASRYDKVFVFLIWLPCYIVPLRLDHGEIPRAQWCHETASLQDGLLSRYSMRWSSYLNVEETDRILKTRWLMTRGWPACCVQQPQQAMV